MQRFRLFNVAALEALRALPFGPGENCVIVCNDWHTALLPVLLKDVYQPRGEYTKTKVALTIHNLSYQVGQSCSHVLASLQDMLGMLPNGSVTP